MIKINYCIENWENEFDFHYFSDIDYKVFPTELSTFVATPAIKAKFRYLSNDPKPNSVIDSRTDSAKVSDIIRIWSQVLRKDEQFLWNEIAGRDLTKIFSLLFVSNMGRMQP